MPENLINTANCRKLGMRLKRFCEAKNTAVHFPNMVRLFEASNADKLTLLRNWLKAGENSNKVEMQLKFEKEMENTHTGTEQLLTIDAMRKKGVSETLSFFCFTHTYIYICAFLTLEGICYIIARYSTIMSDQLRKKILAVTTTQQPVLDRDHPEILEEARWWINVETRTRRSRDRLTLSAQADVQATPDAINALTSGLSLPSTATPGAVNIQHLLQHVQGGSSIFCCKW